MTEAEVIAVLLDYVRDTSPTIAPDEEIPLDRSLFEIGLLDSFGIVEMVAFVEGRWKIRILDAELTQEKFGGINKMAQLIVQKIDQA